MTRATATFHNVEQRKRKHRAKSSKVMMKLIWSYGKQGGKKKKKNKNKKIQFSSREIPGLGRSSRVAGKKLLQHHRSQLKRMETELEKMKAEMRDSTESLMAAKVDTDQAEANLQQLKLKLLELKVTSNVSLTNWRATIDEYHEVET